LPSPQKYEKETKRKRKRKIEVEVICPKRVLSIFFKESRSLFREPPITRLPPFIITAGDWCSVVLLLFPSPQRNEKETKEKEKENTVDVFHERRRRRGDSFPLEGFGFREKRVVVVVLPLLQNCARIFEAKFAALNSLALRVFVCFFVATMEIGSIG
jgi:hypothetical protein